MSEIEKYLDEVLDIKTFGDGVVVVDDKGVIVYFKVYNKFCGDMQEHEVVGKTILEAYPSLKPENSTMLKALRGAPTLGVITEEVWHDGKIISLVENTYPVMKNGKIIGAVNISKFSNYLHAQVSDKGTCRPNTLYNVHNIIGNSEKNMNVISEIIKIAQTSSPVLIYGETGTGKELAAQSVHMSGKRKNRPFLAQNCAAIPATLLESIFFGTTKGSFTGAEERPGIFEKANGGTVFLDEINSMEYALQAKLLRVLEEKKVRRLGSFKDIPVDVRIIASTNKEPHQCITEGLLREDLFYRLSVIQLVIPPLRQKKEDIPSLAYHFIDMFNEEMQKDIAAVDDEVMKFFMEYDWPGNVREMRNVIESMMNFTSGRTLILKELPRYLTGKEPDITIGPLSTGISEPQTGLSDMNQPDFSIGLTRLVEDFEKKCILSAMKDSVNKAQLAKKLGISGQALNYKLKKYAIK